jgi:hypothetical protein
LLESRKELWEVGVDARTGPCSASVDPCQSAGVSINFVPWWKWKQTTRAKEASGRDNDGKKHRVKYIRYLF